jgi:PAS domain S-box-containing protein
MSTATSANPSKPMLAENRRNALALALEVSELRYRRLFETAQDGILILDANSGRIIDANPFLLDLLDYPSEGVIGLQLWEIGLFHDIAANKAAFEILQREEYIRYENLPLRTKGGKKIQVEFVSNVYTVGSDKVIQCNIRDISARFENQEECFGRIASLEVASQARDRMVGVLSHELRTPLAAISYMIDLLDLGHDPVDIFEGKSMPRTLDEEALALIRRNIGMLGSLINDLLDLTHISSGELRLELQRVDMHKLIRFALDNVEHQLHAKNIWLDLQFQAQASSIRADTVKAEQVLANLIGNALKFTPQCGKISILTRNEADDLVVEVRDTGIGIPPTALARIFSPFEQADSSIYPRFGGLGLGLSIAHAVIKAHGGALEVESDGLDQGARFRARFKIDDSCSEETAETDLSCPVKRAAALRILVVEDHEDSRRCMCRLLESRGYQVQAAENSQTALELNDWHDFDLLIADIGLPDGSGLQLLHKMRMSTPSLQAIAVSGYGLPQDLLASKAAGYVAHLIKPVEFSKLDAAIETFSVMQTPSNSPTKHELG